MSIIDLYKDYGIPYVTEGHPHVTRGWVGTHCPFCVGTKNYHLGTPIDKWAFNCWRCGPHKPVKVVSALLGMSEDEASKIIRKYRKNKEKNIFSPIRAKKEVKQRIQTKPFRFPFGCGPVSKLHVKYLEQRGYDPEQIVRTWGLLGTGPIATLDKVDYRFRIIAPIVWGGKTVSFQARDCTGKAKHRYIACVPDREIISHKSILYGRQDKWQDTIIVVEGITDVWRLGPAACAVFGIKYQTEQVLQLVKNFDRVVILFDPEMQAQKQAKKLQAQLLACGTEAVIENLIDCDPGDLKQDDANHLVRNLLKKAA